LGHENAGKILVEKSEGNLSSGRLGNRLKDNIKMEVKPVGCEIVDRFLWIKIGTGGSRLL
jgi:hypothetical protein